MLKEPRNLSFGPLSLGTPLYRNKAEDQCEDGHHSEHWLQVLELQVLELQLLEQQVLELQVLLQALPELQKVENEHSLGVRGNSEIVGKTFPEKSSGWICPTFHVTV